MLIAPEAGERERHHDETGRNRDQRARAEIVGEAGTKGGSGRHDVPVVCVRGRVFHVLERRPPITERAHSLIVRRADKIEVAMVVGIAERCVEPLGVSAVADHRSAVGVDDEVGDAWISA